MDITNNASAAGEADRIEAGTNGDLKNTATTKKDVKDRVIINGSDVTTEKGSPLAALNDFYCAFNQQDMQRMATNWLQSEVASMSNPLGDVKRGWQAIEAVYKKIFTGPAQVYVEFYDVSIVETESMFCAVGRERGWFQIDDERNNQKIASKIELAIRTSRVYQKHEGIWQQLHHHGSIEYPELLQRYQKAVLQQVFSVQGYSVDEQ